MKSRHRVVGLPARVVDKNPAIDGYITNYFRLNCKQGFGSFTKRGTGGFTAVSESFAYRNFFMTIAIILIE
jgi:hypothetical protein